MRKKVFSGQFTLSLNGIPNGDNPIPPGANQAVSTINGLPGYLMSFSGLTLSVTAAADGAQPIRINLGGLSDARAVPDPSSQLYGNVAGSYSAALPPPLAGGQLYHLPFGKGLAQDSPGSVSFSLDQDDSTPDTFSLQVQYWGEFFRA